MVRLRRPVCAELAVVLAVIGFVLDRRERALFMTNPRATPGGPPVARETLYMSAIYFLVATSRDLSGLEYAHAA
jgi:hypothetical protein